MDIYSCQAIICFRMVVSHQGMFHSGMMYKKSIYLMMYLRVVIREFTALEIITKDENNENFLRKAYKDVIDEYIV